LGFKRKKYGGFKEENVYKLYDENMTFQNFKQVIGDLVDRSDGDDSLPYVRWAWEKKPNLFFQRGISATWQSGKNWQE